MVWWFKQWVMFAMSLFLVTKLIYFFNNLNLFIYFSSHISTDYNSCSAYNVKTTCLFCDATKKRVPVSGECKC